VKKSRKRPNAAGIGSKLWLPAIILVVLVVVGYGVNSVRHVSDAISYPPSTSSIPATVVEMNPNNVTYEFSATSAVAGESSTRIWTASFRVVLDAQAA
jgi:hypothetical protein